jgi:hypothetical protein
MTWHPGSPSQISAWQVASSVSPRHSQTTSTNSPRRQCPTARMVCRGEREGSSSDLLGARRTSLLFPLSSILQLTTAFTLHLRNLYLHTVELLAQANTKYHRCASPFFPCPSPSSPRPSPRRSANADCSAERLGPLRLSQPGLPHPTFILHGTVDTAVPVQQSYAFEKRLKEVGVPVGARYAPGAEHSFENVVEVGRILG